MNSSNVPIRVIIVDISSPTSVSAMANLTESLQNVVILSCNLRGVSRIPLLGLFTISTSSECLFPLQIVKGNLQRFKACLNTLKTLAADEKQSAENAATCVYDVMTNAIGQTKKFQQDSQLEFIMFTMKPMQDFVKKVETCLANVDLSNIKKIQLIRICDLDAINENDQPSSDDENNSLNGIVIKHSMKNDIYQFDNYFKNWLHNHDIEYENVHIILPASNESDLIIKCDMFDRIINPQFLQTSDNFLLNLDTQKINISPKSKDNSGDTYQLEAVKLVNLSGICESVVFGHPNILIATSCWKMEWEELETNQQSFTSLCQMLKSKDLVLIVKLKNPNAPCAGHFVIFPSPHSTSLLIKSVAVNEILLPNVEIVCDVLVTKQVEQNVAKHLSHLKIDKVYNVTSYYSNLFQCINCDLTQTLMKPATRRNLAQKFSLK